MAFNPLFWFYDTVSAKIFGEPKSLADDEKIWERRTEEELKAESLRLQTKWMALEDLIQPDLKEADEGFDAFAYFMTLAKFARLKDWTRCSAQEVAYWYTYVQWAANIPFVTPVTEDDGLAKESLALSKRRLEELTNTPRFAPAVAQATTEFNDGRAAWAELNKEKRAEQRRILEAIEAEKEEKERLAREEKEAAKRQKEEEKRQKEGDKDQDKDKDKKAKRTCAPAASLQLPVIGPSTTVSKPAGEADSSAQPASEARAPVVGFAIPSSSSLPQPANGGPNNSAQGVAMKSSMKKRPTSIAVAIEEAALPPAATATATAASNPGSGLDTATASTEADRPKKKKKKAVAIAVGGGGAAGTGLDPK